MKYSDLVHDLNLHITRNHQDDTLAYITHYLQNYGTSAADYFAEVALKHLPANLYPDNITWDISFPSPERSEFTFIDLFAGIGGTRIAFQNLGGKCIFSSEIDFFAKQSYQLNYGEVPFGDITQINEKHIPEHDVLLGGFPCQAFSIAGRRGGFEDTRGTLFFDIARIIREKRPKAFFLENVKGLLNHDKGRTINVILNTLREDLGYFVPDPQVVNAAEFGVPQNRERVYIVGFRDDLNLNEFSYPKPFDYTTSFIDVKEKEVVSTKYYLSDRLLETLRNHRFRHASAGNGFGYEVIDDEGIANAIVTGGMGRERNLVVDRRLTDFTPVTNIKGEINREGIRRMTPREWARLQGFPDKFKIKVSDTQAYKQFGNSVAIPAVQATGKELISSLFANGVLEISEKRSGNDKIKGESGLAIEHNKGEWSEVYTALKLLGDGKIYAADSDLNKIKSIFYPLIKILRSELIASSTLNYEYLYDDATITIVDGDTNNTILNMPTQYFQEKSVKLFEDIKAGSGRKFPVSSNVEKFLKSIHITRMSQRSDVKRDITIVVHDLVTGLEPELGFSIKSKLGRPATLLNASGATNFTFKFTGQPPLSDVEVDRINNTYSSTYERLMEMERLGYKFEFKKMDNNIFESNLQMIDSEFPFIISEMLKYYYKRESTSAIVDILQYLETNNPCHYNYANNHPFYEYKLKSFLVDVALGMMPNAVWKGRYDATGGYIVVKEDGELVCYHVYNRNEFEDYLVKHTRLEAGSRSRHNFGHVYKEGNDIFMKLNIQIRFR